MPAPKPLPPDRLHTTFDPSRLEWENSSQIPLIKNGRSPFQKRAMHALDLALQVKNQDYNVYLSGEANLGRSHMLLSYLRPRAVRMDNAPDLVYVHNFANSDEPVLLTLPSGYGQKLKSAVREMIGKIGPAIQKVLKSRIFRQERARIMENFTSERSSILCTMHSMARSHGYELDLDEDGLSLSPLEEGVRKDSPDHFVINQDQPALPRKKGMPIVPNLLSHAQNLQSLEDDFHQKEQDLQNRAMEEVLNKLFPQLEKQLFVKDPPAGLESYLKDLKKDILDNCEAFLSTARSVGTDEHLTPQTNIVLTRYAINIFVDNSQVNGAPIIMEDNPTVSNLLGCLERESELGALVTDFTLIRSGSLQKANGGFLILHVDDLLQHPQSWDALMRSLLSSIARVEEGSESMDGIIRTRSLSPQPLRFNVKVILIGDEDIFEDLLVHDERFGKLFPIKAHMHDQIERNLTNIKAYLSQIALIAQETELLPFNRDSLAWLIDLASQMCEDQKSLSLRFPLIRNIMIEASALAESLKRTSVNSNILEQAYTARHYRASLVEEVFLADYERQLIKMETSGSAIGQVNGLSIIMQGDFEFGLPHRISCTVGVGHDGIIDLEREAELGGPIHTKAMLILKSYLTRMFARKKPLVLNASLYFEQSYAEIEGDSASGAELAALLSALADVPLRLDLAFTGALASSGQIMAIGGVSRKIEGFYKVCAKKGFTGTQGVIIPHDNIDHLMLSPEVLKSVRDGSFSIYAVRNIEDALFLLTGMPTGKMHKNGSFTKGSLFDLVDRRLENLGCYAQNAFRRQRKE